MQNPWQTLRGRQPFVLIEDEEIIEAFNQDLKPSQQEKYQIRLDLIPEPYIGRPDAPVVLLNLYPSFEESDVAWHNNDPIFKQKAWGNLLHDQANYPFYLLDPKLERAEGHQTWSKQLRGLMKDVGRETVAENVFCIEYFPYHSQKYKALAKGGMLPSQDYSFHLVRQAMQRNALIILMRSINVWQEAIPELDSYENIFALKNPQSPYVSLKNCPTPEHYQMVLDAIQGNTE